MHARKNEIHAHLHRGAYQGSGAKPPNLVSSMTVWNMNLHSRIVTQYTARSILLNLSADVGYYSS